MRGSVPSLRYKRVVQSLAASLIWALCLFLLHSSESTAQTAAEYRKRATQLAQSKSWDDAIATYRKGLSLDPKDALTHYDLALALKYKGENREALKEFEAAVELRPKWAEAHYGLGAIWYELQNQAAALDELHTAATLDASNASVHRLLGRILSQQQNLADAERELRLALNLKPSPEIHLELGVVEGQRGKMEEATAQFRQAIRSDPSLAAAHHMLGIALRRQSDHKTALAEFRKAVALNPNDPESQYDLGRELKADGDNAGAIAAYRRAIERKSAFEQAHYNLGLALRSQGDASSAKKELDELSGLHELRTRLAQSKLLIVQGVDALKQQKLDQALALFQKSADLTPDLPTSHYYLGVAWEQKNEPAPAQAAYEKAVELNPK